METTRTVISKSAKRKIGNNKAGSFTEMVVYKKKVGKKFKSTTKHEVRK